MKINLYLFFLAIILFISCNPFKHKNEVEHDKTWGRHHWAAEYNKDAKLSDCFFFYNADSLTEMHEEGKSLYSPQLIINREKELTELNIKQIDSMRVFINRFPDKHFTLQINMFGFYDGGDDSLVYYKLFKQFKRYNLKNFNLVFITADASYCLCNDCDETEKRILDSLNSYLVLLSYY